MGLFNESNSVPSFEELCTRLQDVEQQLQQLQNNKQVIKQPDQYLDITSTCQYLGMGRTTLYDIMNKGLLAYTYIGRQRRVLLSDIKKYINSTYVASKKSIL